MAEKFQLKALLVAVDKISGPLKGINGALKKTGHTFKQLSHATSKIAMPLGISAAGIAGMAFGLTRIAKSALEYGDQVDEASDLTGVAAEELQGLWGTFGMAGVKVEETTTALGKLNKGMAEAAAAGKGDFFELFKKMGIPLRNSKGEITSITEALPKIASSFEATTNPALRARMAVELFGKAGQKMIPGLMQGGKNIADSIKEMGRLGAIASEGAIKSAGQVNDQLGIIGLQVKAQLVETIGMIGPELKSCIKAIQEWIGANKDMLRLKVGTWLKGLAEGFKAWIAGGGIERLCKNIGDLWDALSGIVGVMGGVKNAAYALGIALAVGPIASLVALPGLCWNAGIALKGLGAAMWALTTAHPIIAIVTAIAGAALLIYNYWDEIKAATRAGADMEMGGPGGEMEMEGVETGGKKMAGFFSQLWGGISSLAVNTWNGIGKLLSGIWDSIKGAASVAWESIKVIFSWTPLGMIIANWQPIVAFFKGIFDEIMSYVQPILDAAGKVAAVIGAGAGMEPGAPGYPAYAGAGAGGGTITRSSIIQPSNANVQGQLRVKFENAPQGMRVSNGQTNQPGFSINPDVGYRSELMG